jgi:hypothetical protein
MLVFSLVLLSRPEHEGTEVQERGVHMYRLAKHLSKVEILRACFAPSASRESRTLALVGLLQDATTFSGIADQRLNKIRRSAYLLQILIIIIISLETRCPLAPLPRLNTIILEHKWDRR